MNSGLTKLEWKNSQEYWLATANICNNSVICIFSDIWVLSEQETNL